MLVFAGHRRVCRDVGTESLTILCTRASGWLVDLIIAVVVATVAGFASTGTACFVVIVAVFIAEARIRAERAFLAFLDRTHAVTIAVGVSTARDGIDRDLITKTVGTAFIAVQTIRFGHAWEFAVVFRREVDRATGPKARDKAYTCNGN